MSCYICDRQIEEPRLDHRDMKIMPCGVCDAAVQDCLDGYPSLDEEDDRVPFAYIEPSLDDYHDIISQGIYDHES